MFYKTSLLFVLISFFSFSQNTSVPDDNFEMYLETHDANLALVTIGDPNSLGDGLMNDIVPTSKINTLQNLDIENLNISDLSGIEDFIELQIFNCKENQLTNVDLSNNVKLIHLYIEGNQLLDLDISNSPDLLILWCFNNQLTNLDLTQNISLLSLRCDNNNLTNLDVSFNVNLNDFTCRFNQISTLNIGNNTNLGEFHCGNNLLTALDLSLNSNLTAVHCESNQITSLDLSQNSELRKLICYDNQLTELDLSNNGLLINLDCSNNNLCSLNIRNGNNTGIQNINFSSNPDLTCVIVDNPSGNHSTWLPLSFTNYVNSPNDCSSQVLVDDLDDFIGTSYTLPTLVNGNYYTESNGNGILLFPGEIIISSQTIYIYNSTQCYSNESSFNVIVSNTEYRIPSFFTPNNDGTNDTWRVIDNTNTFTSIYIYDRYGKLLKSLLPNNFEWNGTFNGNLMNTDDYWFVINTNSGIPIKGHFTLKR
ncbi:T9SS type B sorting domain-containing protein [Seonamhaeicola marinus]|uniref:T9SS type B sorting domain-containing protein n=1 Tax=Seonamhaeicola marinus TaxID=1912246 RepID=A0A5D0HSC8_9FLAO|nr:T9SS type B sorting domain-containing protein [Seonamhaeicola marinus]TYA74188.1 T9SS type B sorting domain-containing protein [Seonamhaeicola marinus]